MQLYGFVPMLLQWKSKKLKAHGPNSTTLKDSKRLELDALKENNAFAGKNKNANRSWTKKDSLSQFEPSMAAHRRGNVLGKLAPFGYRWATGILPWDDANLVQAIHVGTVDNE